jgi:hypothetical protein
MQVPSGCPPPRMASKSLSPTDVKVIPPIHGFVPGRPLTAEEVRGRCRRRNEDDMVAWLSAVVKIYFLCGCEKIGQGGLMSSAMARSAVCMIHLIGCERE